jgi:hypoxanthine phosphoribosyltransferase
LNKRADNNCFPKNSELLLGQNEISDAIEALAKTISTHIYDKSPVIITLMNGGVTFAQELIKHFEFKLEMDYIYAGRYGDNQEGAQLEIYKQYDKDLTDRTVLLLDDIFDEGVTLNYFYNKISKSGAENIYTAVMVTKTKPRKLHYLPDFSAVDIGDKFVFGMGMDYEGLWRNCRDIYVINE